MKATETIGHLEVRNLAAIVICCCLAVFIGVMLTKQYISHSDMAQARILAVKQNLEKRSSAVNYFFSERYGDLEHLRTDQALNGYFENLAMGMSMKYGLKSSLFYAARQFFFILESEVIGQDPIYSRVLFITREGDILIDTLGAPDTFPEFCSQLLEPGEKPREIIGDGDAIAVSMPFYFKKKYAGQLVSFLKSEIIDRHLVRQSGGSAGFYAMTAGSAALYLPGRIPLRLPGTDRIDSALFEDNDVRILDGVWGGKAGTRVIAMRTRIPDTPFSIIALSRTEALSWKNIFAIMSAFVLFIGTGIFFIWRTATQKLIFGVRLQASKQTEKHFRDLVEFLPIPIGEYGFDLKLRYANNESMTFFGYTQADIDTGISITEVIQEQELPKIMERFALYKQGKNPGPS